MPGGKNLPMESRQAQELALDLESEELLGEGERPLSAEDIQPVIEALWERGADFSALLDSDLGSDATAIDEVSED